jgi:hypothetical protein
VTNKKVLGHGNHVGLDGPLGSPDFSLATFFSLSTHHFIVISITGAIDIISVIGIINIIDIIGIIGIVGIISINMINGIHGISGFSGISGINGITGIIGIIGGIGIIGIRAVIGISVIGGITGIIGGIGIIGIRAVIGISVIYFIFNVFNRILNPFNFTQRIFLIFDIRILTDRWFAGTENFARSVKSATDLDPSGYGPDMMADPVFSRSFLYKEERLVSII